MGHSQRGGREARGKDWTDAGQELATRNLKNREQTLPQREEGVQLTP